MTELFGLLRTSRNYRIPRKVRVVMICHMGRTAQKVQKIVIRGLALSFTVDYLGNLLCVCFGRPPIPANLTTYPQVIHNFCGNLPETQTNGECDQTRLKSHLSRNGQRFKQDDNHQIFS